MSSEPDTVILGMGPDPDAVEDVEKPARPKRPPPPTAQPRPKGVHTHPDTMPIRVRWDRNPAGWLVVNREWLARKILKR